MLFKNGERLDLSNPNSEDLDVKDFHEKRKWVKDNIGFPVVFKIKQSNLSAQDKKDGTIEMYMRPMRCPNFVVEESYSGTNEWQYSKVMPRTSKNGNIEFPRDQKNTWYDKKVFSLDEKDMDRIYFLMFKDQNFLKRYYEIDDAKLEANNKVNAKVKETKIQEIFYGSNSVLMRDEKRLREICRAWNISKVETYTRDQLLIELERVVRDQDARGIKSVYDFEKDTQLDMFVEVGAMVQKAEDQGVIKFDEKVGCWFYVNHDGSYKEKICEVPRIRFDHKYEHLKDHIFAEKEHIGRIKSMLGVVDVPDQMKLDFTQLEDEPWEKVAAYCNLNGIATMGRGRNKAAVYKDIRKFAGIAE